LALAAKRCDLAEDQEGQGGKGEGKEDFAYLTTEQIAKRFGASQKTVQRWVSENRFPNAIQRGGTWLIPTSDVLGFTPPEAGPPLGTTRHFYATETEGENVRVQSFTDQQARDAWVEASPNRAILTPAQAKAQIGEEPPLSAADYLVWQRHYYAIESSESKVVVHRFDSEQERQAWLGEGKGRKAATAQNRYVKQARRQDANWPVEIGTEKPSNYFFATQGDMVYRFDSEQERDAWVARGSKLRKHAPERKAASHSDKQVTIAWYHYAERTGGNWPVSTKSKNKRSKDTKDETAE
jgi:excisionase family DNA binding protein